MRRSPEQIKRAAEVFKALSHPERLRVACILIDGGPQTQRDLIEEMDCPQSTVSRYLESLRNNDLIKTQRNANEIIFSINGDILSKMLDSMCEWMNPQH
jgi:DNA-binding transcriptional ArsR family regulator